MTDPVSEHARLHRRQAAQNGTKIVYFLQSDIDTIIELKEKGLSAPRPTAAADSQRRRRGAGAGKRGPARAVAEPVEPELYFSKKVSAS